MWHYRVGMDTVGFGRNLSIRGKLKNINMHPFPSVWATNRGGGGPNGLAVPAGGVVRFADFYKRWQSFSSFPSLVVSLPQSPRCALCASTSIDCGLRHSATSRLFVAAVATSLRLLRSIPHLGSLPLRQLHGCSKLHRLDTPLSCCGAFFAYSM